MKTGELIIDNLDAYTQYGVYVTNGGWNDLVAFPPLKAVDYNDWHEFDGIEADLSNPVLDGREVLIKFASCGDYGSFINMLLDEPYRNFECNCIGRDFRLRLVQQQNLSLVSGLRVFTLKFADDFPMDIASQTRPSISADSYIETGWLIDDIDLGVYGIRVLSGSIAEFQKAAPIKKNLLRNIGTRTGVIYDGTGAAVQSRDVKISCLMKGANLTDFWNRYDALLYDLIQPDERELTVSALNKTSMCYYKSCNVSEFLPSGMPWMKFSLTFCITSL